MKQRRRQGDFIESFMGFMIKRHLVFSVQRRMEGTLDTGIACAKEVNVQLQRACMSNHGSDV